jgi:hypothetical protein
MSVDNVFYDTNFEPLLVESRSEGLDPYLISNSVTCGVNVPNTSCLRSGTCPFATH